MHDIDQLVVRGRGRIAEFVDRVRIGKSAEADELANPFAPVQLQFGGSMSEQYSLQFTRLRTRGLVKRITGTYRYNLTRLGRTAVTASADLSSRPSFRSHVTNLGHTRSRVGS
jgi:hypothetical protein